MEFIQLVGAIFLLISVFCRIQLEMRVPHVVLSSSHYVWKLQLLLRGIGYQRDWISYTERVRGSRNEIMNIKDTWADNIMEYLCRIMLIGTLIYLIVCWSTIPRSDTDTL